MRIASSPDAECIDSGNRILWHSHCCLVVSQAVALDVDHAPRPFRSRRPMIGTTISERELSDDRMLLEHGVAEIATQLSPSPGQFARIQRNVSPCARVFLLNRR